MRVLVCGGRDFNEKAFVYSTLDRLAQGWPGPITIIHGDAKGADRLAMGWAVTRKHTHEPYPANWEKWGPAAGPLRNEQMLRDGKPELVVAFPGGRGTADMVSRAQKAGVPFCLVVWSEEWRPKHQPQN